MRTLFALLLLSLVTSGCVTKSKVQAEVRAAYMAGQRDAFASIAANQRPSVKIIGPVQNPQVPWQA